MSVTTDRDTLGRYSLVALGGGGYCCLMFVWFSLPAYLAPVIDELGLTSTQAGVLVGAIPLTYIPLGLASGYLVDRVGPRIALALALVIVGSSQLLRAVAEGFPSLLLATMLIGVGGTGITFGLPKLAADLVPAERVGTASTIYLVPSYLGTAAAFGLGRPVIGPFLGGWRPLFLASGLFVLVYACLWALAAIVAGRGGVAEPRTEPGDGSSRTFRDDLGAVIGSRAMWLLVVIGTMYLFTLHGLQGWLVTILEAGGSSPAVAGTIASLLVVAQIAGVLAIPPLSDRYDRRHEAVVACGVLCILGPLGLLLVVGGGWFALLPVALIGLGVGGLSPLVRALPVELEGIGPRLTGTAVGLVFAVGEIGGFLGPVIVGVLNDLTGSFVPGIALFACCGVIVVLAGYALDV
ncbi:MFS transporter [Natronorarus salvus]|uniref:MFS transporter n=1 Tax=Natronorarus salvus TaxID=3117733 RepID=UPI002F26CA0A